MLVYKALFGNGPEYPKELIVLHICHEGLRSTQEAIALLEPRTVLTTGCDRSVVKATSVLYHQPLSLKLDNTLDHFKSGLKTYLNTKCFKD